MTVSVELRSVVFENIDQAVLQSRPHTFTIDRRGVLIQTHYSCISAGTEVAKLTGLQKVAYPLQIGNRAIGRVLAVGDEVTHVSVGDLVFSHIHHQSHSLGSQLVCRIPDELDRAAASMLGMALVALTGLQTAQPQLGDTVVITGAGLVGQFAAQLATLSGAYPILIDLVDHRLEVARSCGIQNTINPIREDARADVMTLTNSKGAEVVLECTGVPTVATSATEYAGRNGMLVFVGSPRGEYQTDITPFLEKVHLWRSGGNLTLCGAHEWKIPIEDNDFTRHSMERNCNLLVRLILEDRLKIEPLVSRVYDPEDVAQAYRDLIQRKGQTLGAIFNWTNYHQ